MTLVFGGWSVRPNVSIFLVALVGSWALLTATVRAKILQLRFCREGERERPVRSRSRCGEASVALIVLLVVRSPGRQVVVEVAAASFDP